MSKAEADPLKLIIAAVILLIAMIVIIVIFRGIFSKEANVTQEKILNVGSDSDSDGISDMFDFCKYDSRYQKRDDVPTGETCGGTAVKTV
jgi:hypothetical protein